MTDPRGKVSNAAAGPPVILLVEDNPGDVGLVRFALAEAEATKAFRCELLCAPSLEATMSLLEETEASVVLLDLSLPDAEGFEALHAVTLFAPQTAVIVLTGNEDEAYATESLQRGATDYLTKAELNASSLWRAIHHGIERKSKDAELIKLARADALTGLMNRTVFFERLADVVTQVKRTQAMCAVMYLDLIDFKGINDTFGHALGDLVLLEVGRCLQQSLRSSDLVARLGGDEFAVISTNLKGPDGAAAIAQKILASLASLTIATHPMLRVRTSIGITIYPFDEAGPHELLEHADTALYQAKKEGAGGFCFYDAAMDEAVRRQRALKLEMNQGLANGQFIPHFQPIIDIDTDRVAAVELLARWNHAERGTIPPSDFIPVAEETGVIVELSEQLLESACHHHRLWHGKASPQFPIALNVSAGQFRDGKLTDSILGITESSGVATDSFEIEVTESVLMHDLDVVSVQLNRLRGLGIRVAIDDFGTGYSSLAYLQRLPIDTLKIDRSFIAEIPGDADSCAIIDAVIALAAKLDMDVIAEGVETEAQVDFLRASGVTLMQGYYFCRALCGDDFHAWYKGR